MKIELIPHHTKISRKVTHLDVLAQLTAPAAKKAKKRPTLNLSIALDKSGSMAGDAFEQAKQATLNLLDQLNDTDRIAVVLYNGYPQIILASAPVAQARKHLPYLLAAQMAAGSTALHAGWLAAAQQAAPHVGAYGISRVLLLSDGQATDGKKDCASLKEEAHQMFAAGISTATYGLGAGFNENLMTSMAAGGMARYAQDAGELAPYFAADFELLSQMVAPSVFLRVNAQTMDGTVVEIDQMNDYPKEDDGFWRLPCAVSGAQTWAALRLKFPSLEKQSNIKLHADWKWKDMDGKLHVSSNDLDIAIGRQGKEDDHVLQRCSEAMAGRLAKRVAAEAKRGDLASATYTVGLMRSMGAGLNNAYIGGVSQSLETMIARGDTVGLAKEAIYSSSTMSNRVADIGESSVGLICDRFGLRKALQGKHTANKTPQPEVKS